MEPAYGTHMPSSVPWDLKMSAIDSNGQASAWSQWESLCSWALGNWPIKCFVKNLRVGLEVCHLVEWCAEVVRHIQGRGYRDHPIWGRRKYEEENPWGSGGHKNSCRKETGFPRGFFPNISSLWPAVLPAKSGGTTLNQKASSTPTFQHCTSWHFSDITNGLQSRACNVI